ncbi:MAG: YhdP family protein [Sulfuricellaceae bacterium]
MFKTAARRLFKFVVYALLAAWMVFAAAVMGLRYWVLPHIDDYRDAIAAAISKSARQPIEIGKIEAGWHTLYPYLVLRDVTVHDRQGRPALTLQQVESTLSWSSLLVGGIRLHSLEISDSALDIRRDADGRFFVGGVDVSQDSGEKGFVGWVLNQRSIIIRNATISWNDEKRQAPPLALKRFNLRLENRGEHHRFGLQAAPPVQLAAPLDIRGDLVGANVQDLLAWRGALYARLNSTDLAAWGAWLDLPFDLRSGLGAVRLWLNFDRDSVTDARADVALSAVDLRLAADLPRLELQTVSGHLGLRSLRPGYELHTQQLTFVERDGGVFPPADVILRHAPAAGNKPETGEIRVAGLDLDALTTLAVHLPLSAEQRGWLAQSRPHGALPEFSLKWEGDWSAPRHYAAKGRFTELGAKPFSLAEGGRKLPGFTGFSGNFDANEKGGWLALNASGANVELPGLFAEALALDTLTAQASWKALPGSMEFRLDNANFSNKHLAGTAYGSYRHAPGAPGAIDLTGQLTRADARQVSRYIPLVVGKDARSWLEASLLGGQSQDVRLRLKGNLADFPFNDGKKGLFEVVGKVTGGTLEYAPGWPKIENITVDLLFRGARMDINASAGNTYGMNISKVHAALPNLLADDEVLEVEGVASGPTADMLKFIGHSPVAGMIDHFTDGMQATGNGNFNLNLKLPLRHSKDTLVAGSYQFLNNRVVIADDLPTLDQVNGRLEFTDSQVKIPDIAFQAAGVAANMSGASQKDGSIRLDLRGRISAAGIARLVEHPLAQRLSGSADLRGLVSIRKKKADFTVDSTLVGLAANLPTPLGKQAAEPVAFHLEKRFTAPNRDTLLVGYGSVLSAQFNRRFDNGKTQIERGVINLGAAARERTLPTQGGVWINGELLVLDIDLWRRLFEPQQSASASSFTIAGINFKCEQLDVYGRRFNGAKITATTLGENWKATVRSRELSGDISWRPEGNGRIEARLKTLSVPEASPSVASSPPSQEVRNLPALDIVAESFQVKQKKLGRLELKASNEGDDWRIEQLKLSNPDATFTMNGEWQAWQHKPATRANVKLEVQDIGKLLVRLGYPDAVKRGTATLEGQLYWSASPQDLDFASLSGSMKLEAHNGQFLKIEPGIGKLLSILSLQALPRRITLDFRDVFSEGFTFDDISGTLRANRGVLSSDDFKIEGPPAKISMTGKTDLAAETQNLRVRVVPEIGAGLALAGALLNPVAGVTALIVQKLLKDPLGQIAAYEYSITGTWDNPIIEKVRRKVEPNENKSDAIS